MSLLQKTIAELRELQHEEIDLVGGAGQTSESTYCPSMSWIQTPVGPSNVTDDGSGDGSSDWVF